jgi:metal-responsive CopG/Arc/MetJ family transcriptional regulator
LSEYSKISLKKELMEKIEQFIREYPEHGYRSLAQFIEDAVRRRADELRVFELTPRFRHFNTNENRKK